MATFDVIAARQTYNSAALATMGVCPIWDAAIAKLLAAKALADADNEYGVNAKAEQEDFREECRLERLYGPAWHKHPAAQADRDRKHAANLAADAEWTRTYCEPLWQAVRDLTLVPAPSLAAALFKANMIEADEPYNDTKFPHDCMAIVQADFARLATESPRAKWDALVARLEAIEAKPIGNDEEIDEAGDLIAEIMAMPAPDADAACWKLDYILAAHNGSTGSYDVEYIAQMVTDYRRFLTGRA